MDGGSCSCSGSSGSGSCSCCTSSCTASSGRCCATCARRPANRRRPSGRLVIVESPAGEPPAGHVFALDSITTLGRDVNNSIVVDDPFASAEHAVLTFRGSAWYVEDLGSTNGTYVNGHPVAGVATIGYGDELQIGQVRCRLERPRT